jgi:hypothetical protein
MAASSTELFAGGVVWTRLAPWTQRILRRCVPVARSSIFCLETSTTQAVQRVLAFPTGFPHPRQTFCCRGAGGPDGIVVAFAWRLLA